MSLKNFVIVVLIALFLIYFLLQTSVSKNNSNNSKDTDSSNISIEEEKAEAIKSLKQFKIDADSFGKKLKTLKTDIKQTKTKLKQIPQPEVEKIKPKNVKLVGGSKVTGDVEPDFIGPKRERSKTATKNRKLQNKKD